MKMWNGISVTLHTTVGPQCDVIHSNFAFGVGVDLHLHRVHFLVSFRYRGRLANSLNTPEAGINLPAGCHSVRQWPKISIFAPVGKTMFSKNDSHLLELSRRSISACKVWVRSSYAHRLYRCRSENWYFLYVTLGLPARGGHSWNKYFVTVYGSILMLFSAIFFRMDCSFRCTT